MQVSKRCASVLHLFLHEKKNNTSALHCERVLCTENTNMAILKQWTDRTDTADIANRADRADRGADRAESTETFAPEDAQVSQRDDHLRYLMQRYLSLFHLVLEDGDEDDDDCLEVD